MPAAGNGHPLVREYIDSARGRTPATFALEGLWAIRRALDASIHIDVLFVCRALERGDDAAGAVEEVRASGATVLDVSERVLLRMVRRKGPDGLAAIARMPTRTLDDLAIDDAARLVIADGIELPGNLGTIVRCADGAGAAGVVRTGRRVRANHPLVVKASMGTVFSTPVVDAEPAAAHAWLRENRVRIVATDPHAVVSYLDVDYDGPIAVVLGNERHGLASF